MALDAHARLRRTRASLWPDGRRDGSRLEGIVDIDVYPSFHFAPGEKVMTIGSCFAREIEKHLGDLGFDLPMTKVDVPLEERVSSVANDILNKYSIHSIEYELRAAFEGSPVPLEKLLLETDDGLWHDPQLAPNLKPASFERVAARREEVLSAVRELAGCGLVIVTLGLAESWIDLETGLYLNGAVPMAAIKRHPGRFAIDVLSYSEILESLERTYALIRKHGRPDVKMLITTSPVPFKATFSGGDALVSNSYSKSVQRAACSEFAADHDGVDYFPSYEMVMLTDRRTAFFNDNIHVLEPVVQKIMKTVMAHYCKALAPKDAVNPKTIRTVEELTELGVRRYGEHRYEESAEAYEQALERFRGKMTEDVIRSTLMALGVARLRSDSPERGIAALREALTYSPMDDRLHFKLGLGYSRVKQPRKAIEYLRNAMRLAPDNADYPWRVGVALLKVHKVEEAQRLFRQALEMDPNHALAKAALARISPRAVAV